MSKQFKVQTSRGWLTYKIRQSGTLFYCHERGGLKSKSIGKARSYEDAVSLLREDAQKYGPVLGLSEVNFVT